MRNKIVELYRAVNQMMMEVGYHGQVSSDSAEADGVMGALADLDDGVFDVDGFAKKLDAFLCEGRGDE